VAVVAGLYSLAYLGVPTLWMANSLWTLEVLALVVGLFILYVLGRALLARARGSWLLTLGFVAFFGSVLHDILVTNGSLPGPYVAPFGLLVLFFTLSLVITRLFAMALEETERLADALLAANRAMKRFVPAEFLACLGRTGVEQVELGDARAVEMAVLFADIGNFTGLSEAMTPEETFAFINTYLERMGPAIRAHGGFVDKYLGDGIMALFAGPSDNAVACAVDMFNRLASFNTERVAGGLAPISIRVGIHAGKLVLGTIGDRERMDGTVISDTVNMASRLEGVAKTFGVGIAVSEHVAQALRSSNRFRVRPLGRIRVKGKRDPVATFEIYDGDDEATRRGKDATLSAFETALDDVHNHRWECAAMGFRRVLAILPDDKASNYYLRLIEGDPISEEITEG